MRDVKARFGVAQHAGVAVLRHFSLRCLFFSVRAVVQPPQGASRCAHKVADAAQVVADVVQGAVPLHFAFVEVAGEGAVPAVTLLADLVFAPQQPRFHSAGAGAAVFPDDGEPRLAVVRKFAAFAASLVGDADQAVLGVPGVAALAVVEEVAGKVMLPGAAGGVQVLVAGVDRAAPLARRAFSCGEVVAWVLGVLRFLSAARGLRAVLAEQGGQDTLGVRGKFAAPVPPVLCPGVFGFPRQPVAGVVAVLGDPSREGAVGVDAVFRAGPVEVRTRSAAGGVACGPGDDRHQPAVARVAFVVPVDDEAAGVLFPDYLRSTAKVGVVDPSQGAGVRDA